MNFTKNTLHNQFSSKTSVKPALRRYSCSVMVLPQILEVAILKLSSRQRDECGCSSRVNPSPLVKITVALMRHTRVRHRIYVQVIFLTD